MSMHSNFLPLQNTMKQKSSSNQGEILCFDSYKRQKQAQHCIFCNTTSLLQNFKGKTVCSECLQNIPELFSVPSHYVT
ncbi:hypothetical protein Dhaf_4101 [Desulfitobacterium hafniense DCB-2]|uniref:Uncharacterized protein n=2 Tax=Desulfitobacterium hafniense TaxID=49338 RepID=A0A098B3W2_DESHA|nr:hypothetical protein Dhaf_4101 [Desulfitobacterium hafniense DCB-2]CDX03065.1 Hypothetical protein DPCES_3178 [Desulfitobacterium hafniense]